MKNSKIILSLVWGALLCFLPLLCFAQGHPENIPIKKDDMSRIEEQIKNEQIKLQYEKEGKEAESKKLSQEESGEYDKLLKKIKGSRRHKLERLKLNNPEKFKEEMKKLKKEPEEAKEDIKTEQPQLYQPEIRQRDELKKLRELKAENQDEYKEYLKTHPHLKEGMEDRRERGADLRERDRRSQTLPSR